MPQNEETLLVVGGSGYIGSHMVKMLLRRCYRVLTLDNLSSGYRDAVLGGEFVLGDPADRALLDTLFGECKIDGVMQFVSFIQVGEFVQNPAKYYENNVVNTLILRAASWRAPDIKVFGCNYDTPDGTCIRDFVQSSICARRISSPWSGSCKARPVPPTT